MLDPLIDELGSQEAAMGEMHSAAQALTKFPDAYEMCSWLTIKVGGIAVSITGRIMDGIFRISTATRGPF
jgi:hypothetical protein